MPENLAEIISGDQKRTAVVNEEQYEQQRGEKQRIYTAVFSIKHGISHGFGLKEDAESEEVKEIRAGDDVLALMIASGYAHNFAREYDLSDNSGFTSVTLVSLRAYDQNGLARELDQAKTVRSYFQRVHAGMAQDRLENAISRQYPRGKKLVKCSSADHILGLLEAEKSQCNQNQ